MTKSISALSVTNLTKIYGTYKAVDTITFAVPQGGIVGLLGPNGAGKTTTIQILLGITQSNGGRIEYFGMDFSKAKQACLARINFASSFNTLQGRISVMENLLVFADLYCVKNARSKIAELTELLEITNLVKMKYWDLSKGQQTRVNIVKALLNDPELLLFDEPTASLDPDIADKLLSLIERMRDERKISILYTSHDMAEVTRICDEVIFLDHGVIAAHDTPLNLTQKIEYARLQITFGGEKKKIETLMHSYSKQVTFPFTHTICAEVKQKEIPAILAKLSKAQIAVEDISIEKPTLDDVFMQIARGTYDFTPKN
ncbi:MAG: ABC transporter ATP-binding protein [Patescibacteria group bacterium]